MLPADSPLDITEFKILNSATGQVETVSVRDYVRGAVAAELPATFHAEAMKAQAVAAHTWALCPDPAGESRPGPEGSGLLRRPRPSQGLCPG